MQARWRDDSASSVRTFLGLDPRLRTSTPKGWPIFVNQTLLTVQSRSKAAAAGHG